MSGALGSPEPAASEPPVRSLRALSDWGTGAWSPKPRGPTAGGPKRAPEHRMAPGRNSPGIETNSSALQLLHFIDSFKVPGLQGEQ